MKDLRQLAELVEGVIIGDPDLKITGLGSAKEGAEKGTITFAENREIHKLAEKTGAAAVIVPKDITESEKSLIQVDNPRLAFAQIAQVFAPRPLLTEEIHPTSTIHDDAQIGENVSIHPNAVIDAGAKIGKNSIIGPGVYIGKGVQLGENCIIHANVVVEYDTQIGDRVIIHAGSVLGSDGYGYVTTEKGHEKLPQLGKVVIEDDVELGANVAIDRGAIGDTVVGRGTKIDNLVHLAHNVKVGPECIIVGQVGIAGSAKVGKRVTMGGQVGVIGHLEIGDNVMVAARGVVSSDVKSDSFISGNPAIDHRENFKIKAACRRTPQLRKKVRKLEKKLAQLEEKLSE